jgi:6-phosphogluconolactonase
MTAPSSHRLYLGTSGTDGRGIYTAVFDTAVGTLSTPTLLTELPKASFQCFAGADRLLSISQTPGSPMGEVVSFKLDATVPAVTEISRVSSGATGVVHVSAHGSSVLVANYIGGSAISLHMDAEGKLTPATYIAFNAEDHGPDPKRQDHAYGHGAVVTPDGGYVLINDLGCDRIHILKLDAATANMTPHGEWKCAPGAGPRHVLMHPNDTWIYNINEMGCTIDQLAWDATTGTLTTLQTIDTLPAGVDKTDVRACDMVFARDLRFLYAANRVHEDFVVYSIDEKTGNLALVQQMDNPGKESRHFAVDPSGNWFLSANQFSNEIAVFPIDTATGKLGERSSGAAIHNPSCLLFG